MSVASRPAYALLGAEPTYLGREESRFRRRGSFRVFVAGPRRGEWQDFEADRNGDPLGLAAYFRGVPMPEARRWALAWLGMSPRHPMLGASRKPPAPPGAPPAMARRESDTRRKWSTDVARADLREAVPAAAPGSLAPVYLASRPHALALPPDAPLRFHPRAWRKAANGPHSPAMVALITDPTTGGPCGAHVTYLAPDGRRMAPGPGNKILLRRIGAARLVPAEEVGTGLGIAEGTEKALAVMERAGWRPVWSACCAHGIIRFPRAEWRGVPDDFRRCRSGRHRGSPHLRNAVRHRGARGPHDDALSA